MKSSGGRIGNAFYPSIMDEVPEHRHILFRGIRMFSIQPNKPGRTCRQNEPLWNEAGQHAAFGAGLD